VGFVADALSRASFPEIDGAAAHLRDVLGGDGYAEVAQAGANMTNAEIATYAFDQIDRARAELLAAQTDVKVPKSTDSGTFTSVRAC